MQSNCFAVIFWLVASVSSIFWAVYGWYYEKHLNQKKTDRVYPECLFCLGAAISEFLGSMGGWLVLWIFSKRYMAGAFGNVDIALIVLAIIGISGYSYRLIEVFSNLTKK